MSLSAEILAYLRDGPPLHSRAWFIERSMEASQTMAKLREVLPGCFDEHGRAIVAAAYFPRGTHDDR